MYNFGITKLKTLQMLNVQVGFRCSSPQSMFHLFIFFPSIVHRNKNFVYKRRDRDVQYSPILGRSSRPILVHEV